MSLPELDEFRRQLELLRTDPAISALTTDEGRVELSRLSLDDVIRLMTRDDGHYFLLAATALNRTSLRQAAAEGEALVVPPRKRKAFAVRARLPISIELSAVLAQATALRQGDLQRKARGHAEQHFRDRLLAERVPLLMSPPRRVVPGAVIAGRKPDGVWPDPATGAPPVLYLEIKNIRRVADDIQKRLYELAEAALEMKLIYGRATFTGLGLRRNDELPQSEVAARLRDSVTGSPPFVVGLLLCPRAEAERYRTGAEAFIDRIFFQEEIEECIAFIDHVISTHPIT